ncbi:MAG: hypothetical protein A2176_06635 [Spirochaetes bacterium RBG_13_51_14]|nr:MAG: hypothetical protein A2176_06635 [Spirochaetes bacterium RBG_13_51_14]
MSVFPVYDIARNICGDKAFPFFVIPAGADPHTFEPLPSVASELRNVSLFIGVTREFDGWIERYLPERAVRRYLISPDAGSTHTANPHIWLSVRQAEKIAASIARSLEMVDAANIGYYRKNLAAYLNKLNELDKTIAGLFKNTRSTSFIQWHEAWNYLAADYNLTIAGTVQREGSDRASVRSIKEIVDRAKRDRVRVIVVSLNAEIKAALVLANEIRGTVVRLDGIGDPDSDDRSNYIKLMLYNAQTLAAALR